MAKNCCGCHPITALNPNELIWAQVKTEIKKRNSNGDQSLKNVEKITQEAIHHGTPKHWQNVMSHVRKIETDYRANDTALEHWCECKLYAMKQEAYSVNLLCTPYQIKLDIVNCILFPICIYETDKYYVSHAYCLSKEDD